MKASAISAETTTAHVAAGQAGLRYVLDDGPGITRRLKGDTFVYHLPSSARLRDKPTLQRIRALAIPPAWTEVWICPTENGHIQATGRDARGRKQYRYHARWRAVRDASKYERVLAFGAMLPRIRQHVAADLRRKDLSREKVMATIVRLLETTLIRVGNDEYAQQNGSYGLTTLHNRHARVNGTQITFSFKGKSGRKHEIGVKDPRLAKLVRRCQELPGQQLFEYLDEEGAVHAVTSDDVNAYLRDIAGDEFSAKDFRTWAGSVHAAVALSQFETFHSLSEAKKQVVQAIELVADKLGNTAAVCRRCYIHPAILDGYMTGQFIATIPEQGLRKAAAKLRPEEAAVMAMLKRRRASESQNAA